MENQQTRQGKSNINRKCIRTKGQDDTFYILKEKPFNPFSSLTH